MATFMGREEAVPGRRLEGICRNLEDLFPHLGGGYTSVFVIIHSVEHLYFMYFSICMSYFAIKDCKIYF